MMISDIVEKLAAILRGALPGEVAVCERGQEAEIGFPAVVIGDEGSEEHELMCGNFQLEFSVELIVQPGANLEDVGEAEFRSWSRLIGEVLGDYDALAVQLGEVALVRGVWGASGVVRREGGYLVNAWELSMMAASLA